ncbi:MAG: class I SAM-dependent methyltransferase [Thermomicrobiales bacterium]
MTTEQSNGIGNDGGSAEAFWEPRYRESGSLWSGTANEVMRTIVETLPPGRSLDLGCSNGGDAIWLAQHGWEAMGVDVAPTAIALARSSARKAGVTAGVRFEQYDLSAAMPDGPFDLVSAAFFHTPVPMDRPAVLRRAAERLSPDGHLLIIDHGSFAPWSCNQDPDHVFPAPEEIFASLDLDRGGWTPELLTKRDREAEGPNGEHAVVRDTIVLVRRLK